GSPLPAWCRDTFRNTRSAPSPCGRSADYTDRRSRVLPLTHDSFVLLYTPDELIYSIFYPSVHIDKEVLYRAVQIAYGADLRAHKQNARGNAYHHYYQIFQHIRRKRCDGEELTRPIHAHGKAEYHNGKADYQHSQFCIRITRLQQHY